MRPRGESLPPREASNEFYSSGLDSQGTPGVERQEEISESRELIERLQPEIVEDKDSFRRPLYTFQDSAGNDVRVLFYEREALPDVSYGAESEEYVFGEKPRWRSGEDWEHFTLSLQNNHTPGGAAVNPGVIHAQSLEQGKGVFMVEQSSQALLDMAITLGAKDEQGLRNLRLLASRGRSNEELEQLVDGVIAAKYLDDRGSLKTAPDTEGEALTLLALTGDQHAETFLKRKREQMEAMDRERDAALQEEMRAYAEQDPDTEALDSDALVAVHMTKYLPQEDEKDDTWQLKTTYDATDKLVPRVTQHFTMNHPIRGAGMYGSWEGTSIGVIIPLNDLMEKNGKPSVLNTVDTFWEVSPGRRTEIPRGSARLVRPGHIDHGVSQKRGNEILYKDRRFTAEDVRAVVGAREEKGRLSFNRRLLEAFSKALTTYNYDTGETEAALPEEDFYRIAEVMGAKEQVNPELGIHGISDDERRDVLTEMEHESVQGVVEKIFHEAGVDPVDHAVIVERIVRNSESLLALEVKEETIRDQIRDMGYEVHGGGMWAWDSDSWEATAQTVKLGAEIGVRVGPHSSSISHGIESTLIRNRNSLQSGDETYRQHKAGLRASIGSETILQASNAMRRMLYESGTMG